MTKSKGQYKHEWYLKNRDKIIIDRKKWALENPEKVRSYGKKWRDNNLLKLRSYRYRRLGIKQEDVYALFENHSGLCAICNKKLKLFIDHCHKDKKLRGLLCHQCNIGLGSFSDNVVLLNNAITYLKKYAGSPGEEKETRAKRNPGRVKVVPDDVPF